MNSLLSLGRSTAFLRTPVSSPFRSSPLLPFPSRNMSVKGTFPLLRNSPVQSRRRPAESGRFTMFPSLANSYRSSRWYSDVSREGMNLMEEKRRGWGSILTLLAILAAVPLLFILFIRPSGGAVDTVPPSRNLYAMFRDTETLFRSKSTGEIYSTLFVYKLCQFERLVDFGAYLLQLADQWHLSAPFYFIIRRTFFQHFCGGETFQEVEAYIQRFQKRRISFILDSSVEDSVTKEAWDKNTSTKIDMLTKAGDMKKISFIPVKITSIGPATLLEKMTTIINQRSDAPDIDWKAALSPEEFQQLQDLTKRLDQIMETSKKFGVPILLDAEQTFRQPALDYIALVESKKWNKDSITVYNTYQMYLKRSANTLKRHMEISKKQGFFLGVKMVRGAYIVSEKKRASDLGYESPILFDKFATDDNYKKGILLVLSQIASNQKYGLVVATHNLTSVLEASIFCQSNKIPFNHPNIHFAQLKGMADNISAGLEEAGFRVSKLVPYGEVKEVMPYLIRRTQENRDVMGGTQFERELLWLELKKRQFGWKKWRGIEL